MNTSVQFDSTARVVTFPLAHAITIRLLPVNSSAPAGDTPKSDPAWRRTSGKKAHHAARQGADAPVLTVVAKIAPNAMNAPPSTLNTSTVNGSVAAS